MITTSHFILYVSDQDASTAFYSAVLGAPPHLNVTGMTEFTLGPDTILGLMPITGIKRLLGEALPDPSRAAGIPRAEVYLMVDDPSVYYERALTAGARELSPLSPRDWGHAAAYILDPDGHVVAFAKYLNPPME